jgi:acetylornithine deacetylase/succinyl-diaminopimelate desuccinylase-like protein
MTATLDLESTAADALAFLAAREERVVDLTRALIAAPSLNPPGDESAPAAVVREALRELGLPEPQLVAAEPHRPNLIVRIDAAHPGPHLGLCGHLDTKPVGEAAALWRTDPFVATRDGDRLYGLGSTDMKGAVAAMILAGAAFAAVADRAAGSLSLVFTADEEYGSAMGAGHLARQGLPAVDALVLGEPSGVHVDWEAIRIVSRGVSGFKVLVEGTQMHSSISDQLPSVNAVEAMARVLVGLRRELRLRHPAHPLCPTGPTINLGVRTLGGVGYGVLPGHAEFWSDIRPTPGMTFETLREDVEAALARLAPEAPGATVALEFAPGLAWLPPSEVPVDHPAVVACQAAARRILGRKIPPAAFPGGTDASSFQIVAGIPTIAAFGPGLLPLAHGPNEWVSVTSLLQASRVYALAALIFGAGRQGVV